MVTLIKLLVAFIKGYITFLKWDSFFGFTDDEEV